MKLIPAALLLALLPALAPAEKPDSARHLPAASPETVGMSPAKLRLVDAKVNELIDRKRIAGASVMITRRGKLVYHKSFGLRDVENQLPMKKDTIFRIYSMTKAITSAATMILVEEGKVHLEDPLSKYLPEYKMARVWKQGKQTEKQTHRKEN